ncbi:hypothetical protein AB1Y20_006073 [Prymnesium parvum]|uniref:VPS9 domain-containing protein n=1 Tax=Prymnesium parvum TaxID=97485 RepID=A0AB34J3T7_PRYPA
MGEKQEGGTPPAPNATSPAPSRQAVCPTAFLDSPRAANHILCAIQDGRDDLLTAGVFRCCAIDTAITGISATHWDFGGHAFIGAKAALGLAAVGALVPSTHLAVGMYVVATNSASSIKNAIMGGAAAARKRMKAHDEAFYQALGFSREQLLGVRVIPTAAAFWDLREGDTVIEIAVKAKRGRLGNSLDSCIMHRLLVKLVGLLPCSACEKQARLDQALVRCAEAMKLQQDHACFDPLRQCWQALRAQMRLEENQLRRNGGHVATRRDDGKLMLQGQVAGTAGAIAAGIIAGGPVYALYYAIGAIAGGALSSQRLHADRLSREVEREQVVATGSRWASLMRAYQKEVSPKPPLPPSWAAHFSRAKPPAAAAAAAEVQPPAVLRTSSVDQLVMSNELALLNALHSHEAPLGRLRFALVAEFEAYVNSSTELTNRNREWTDLIGAVHAVLDTLTACAVSACTPNIAACAGQAETEEGVAAAVAQELLDAALCSACGEARQAWANEEAVARVDKLIVVCCVERSVFCDLSDGAAQSSAALLPLPGLVYSSAMEAVRGMVAEKDATFQMKQARWATEPSFALGALPEDVVDYQLATTALLEMQASCTPTQKIDCLVRVLLAVSSSDTSADEMLPSLMFALVKSPLRAPAAECAFIVQFVHQCFDLHGEAGYALASFECAIVGVTGLPMDPADLCLD